MEEKSKSGSRSFIKSVIEVSHIEFSSYDIKNHALTYSSGLASKILGYTEEEMRDFSQDYNRRIIHPDDLQTVNEQLETLMASKPGQIVEMIVRYRRHDGRYIWGYTRKMVTDRDENGTPTRMTIVAEDITELVSLQEELEARVAELEKVSFRNHHELKGPVASILGLTNMIRDKDMIAEYNREIMQHLCRTVAKLDTVVSEIAGEEEDL